ncbi:MFS transporter [Rhodococcus opacus]|uniref:MFS transporter n=1 Tax=Rhodococcus opacus TaxID=37919 RepID=UPI002474AE3D|nr:MFS transporter [Rhodococcus opacus]MDH6292849.1 MHS family proline/betaine transporter-like MFS transporter [Rhodococcus opacus]
MDETVEAPIASQAALHNSDKVRRRGVLAAAVGTVVEYYDLMVYAYLAVVISPVFFPGYDTTAALLATLAVMASAYFVRPIGGIFLGRLGDRYGRKRALMVSVGMMGLGTMLMAVLPTYETIGVLAPILLVVVRLVQGFSAGGEYGGALTFVYETVGRHRKGLATAFVVMGTNGGCALAAVVVGVVSGVTTEAQMSSWGWRIPFVVGLPLLLFCLWTRTRIEDTEQFTQAVHRNEVTKSPLLLVLRTHRRAVLQVFGIGLAANAAGYMVLTYIGIHLVRQNGYPQAAVSWTIALFIAIVALLTPVAGLLVDRFGSLRVILAGLLLTAGAAYPALAAMAGHGLAVAGVAFLAFSLGTPLIQVGNAPLMTSLFATSVRQTGVSLAFNLSNVAAGGTAAYISTWLINTTGDPLSPSYFLIGTCLIALVSLATIRRRHIDIPESPNQPPEDSAVLTRLTDDK